MFVDAAVIIFSVVVTAAAVLLLLSPPLLVVVVVVTEVATIMLKMLVTVNIIFHFSSNFTKHLNYSTHMVFTCCSETHMDRDTRRFTWSRISSTSILLKQWFKNTNNAVCSRREQFGPSIKHASNICWKKPGKCSGIFLNG